MSSFLGRRLANTPSIHQILWRDCPPAEGESYWITLKDFGIYVENMFRTIVDSFETINEVSSSSIVRIRHFIFGLVSRQNRGRLVQHYIILTETLVPQQIYAGFVEGKRKKLSWFEYLNNG